MLDISGDEANRVVCVEPRGPLQEADFEELAAVVDPIIASHGALGGLMIHTQSFPGWEDFAGFLSHMRFVKEHQSKIGRVALVTDSALASVGPKLAKIFVSAEVEHFAYADMKRARAWIAAQEPASD
ncbi:MAG: STAS/SEC14 domain-containing protein [Deltaproteobacteria bacterium]|nr:STAS/SEC14 domain-containing protein [Deltaproteobacteria bacterium]MBW2419456.1 STAS/SEC14 domain-containing protein [Deltaproteobacteria bacterium]